MRALKVLLVLWCTCCSCLSANAATARLLKVLPHFVDREGRVSLSPSLYERDAYQTVLRSHPAQRGGLRFDVQWKASTRAPLSLRVELRGMRDGKETTARLETTVKRRGLFSNWAEVTLTGKDYQGFGELRAWRATLWEGSTQLAEQQSFLW